MVSPVRRGCSRWSGPVPSSGRGTTLVARSCPYMGLLPFQREDDRVFFGRTEEVGALVDRVARDRFVAVVGASGSGKSSLLRAGLVASLERGALPGSDAWTSVVLTPGARPLAELAADLAPVCGDSATDFLHDLEIDPRALDVAARQSLTTRRAGSKIVLVIDQLEELFTLCTDETDRRRFLDALVDAASAPDAPSVIVVALRADFFGHAATHKELARLLERQTLLLGPMDEEGLRNAIEGPARVAGLSLEPGLPDVILSDIAGEPGGLPLLSHALLEVWSRRDGRTLTIAGYRASGGVRGAIRALRRHRLRGVRSRGAADRSRRVRAAHGARRRNRGHSSAGDARRSSAVANRSTRPVRRPYWPRSRPPGS